MDAPPPLVSFDNIEKYISALDTTSKALFAEDLRRLHHLGLPAVASTRTLATLFGYSAQFVGAMVANPERYYRSFSIPKGKRRRHIDAPRVALKVIQKWLGFHLSREVLLPDCVVGFVPGRSTYDGAVMHCSSEWIYSTDITDFFPSTRHNKVVETLETLGYSSHGSKTIAGLCCVNGGLAQGSPASPVLANLAFLELDKKLLNFSKDNSLTYSRYADDIVISGRGKPPNDLRTFVEDLTSESGWDLSPEKTSTKFLPKRLKVYGLVVNGSLPRLTKGYRKRIRAIRHLKEAGKIPADKMANANGHLAYADSIRSRQLS